MSIQTEDSLLFSISAIALIKGSYSATPPMDLHATDFTIAAKVNVKATNARNIILGNWGAAGNSWQMLLTVQAGGTPQVHLRKDMVTNGSDPEQELITLAASTPITANAWHHVAVTMTWGANHVTPTATIYVNGAAAGTASPAITPNPKVRNPYALMPTSNPYLIGKKQDSGDDGSWFAGQINDLRVYRAALSASDIKALAAAS